jgi:GTP-binding protein
MTKKLHKVVVVGRANVGKSTLFNKLSTDIKSITLDYIGVTRDFLKDTVSWNGRSFELIDTGGIQLTHAIDPLTEKVRLKALDLLQEATIVLFLCDGSIGVMPEDRAIAKVIHKMGKPTFLLINKCDVKKTQEHIEEFDRLGFKNTLLISAQHSIGTGELLNEIIDQLPPDATIEEDTPKFRVVFLGKPNVGKSSLMNIVMKQERSLVYDAPGTTREAISDTIRFYQETIQITDTAGVRRPRSVEEGIEELMVKSSLQAVRDADIVLLVVDAQEGAISHQELKLASYVFETGKALIIVRNKHDLLTDDLREEWKQDDDLYDHIIKKVETLTISCKSGHHLGKLLPLIEKVWERYQFHLSMSEVTQLFKGALEKTPLIRNQQKLKVFSAKQVATNPPTIRLNVNEPKWFETSQLGFFENLLRKNYDLKGVPVKFLLRRIQFE